MTSTNQTILVTHTSKELLEEAHDKYMADIQREGGDIVEYLLDATEYLQNNDWEGYKEKFIVKTAEPRTINIRECKDCKGPIISDGPNGNSKLVCSECGIVSYQGGGWNSGDNITWERKMNTKHRIHKYIRLVNFKDLLRKLQANNRCCILDEDRQRLVDVINANGAHETTPADVLDYLKELKLVHKHRRHKERLAWEHGNWKAPRITFTEYRHLCDLFRQVERVWKCVKGPNDKRKVFLNYPFCYDQLCKLAGYEHLRVLPQLKSKKLLRKQFMYWKRILYHLKNKQ